MKNTPYLTLILVLIFAFAFGCVNPKNDELSKFEIVDNENSMGIIAGKPLQIEQQKALGVVGIRITGLNENGQKTTWGCSGTIISKKLVLTAAHCFSDESLQSAEIILSTSTTNSETGDLISVENIEFHDNYWTTDASDAFANQFDFAILSLNSDVPSDFRIQQLPEGRRRIESKDKVIFAGFGSVNPLQIRLARKRNGRTILNSNGNPMYDWFGPIGLGALRIVENVQVNRIVNPGLEFSIDQRKKRSGACHGDSGGPAYIQLGKGKLIQVGVISRTTAMNGNCNREMIIGNLTTVLDWINLIKSKY